MLKYSFSTREKTLIAIFAVIILALLWYVLIFQGVNEQAQKLDSEIATAKETITIDTAKLTQQKNMQDAIDRYVASGAKVVETPKYDNIQNVMDQLNSILASTTSYTISFDDIESKDGDTVARGVSLTFGCGSYEEAVGILTSFARGDYPCRINECSISSSGNIPTPGATGANKAAYAVTAHLIYIERMK